MTLLWFIVWLTADPVNFWAGSLILAIALDLGGIHASPRRR